MITLNPCPASSFQLGRDVQDLLTCSFKLGGNAAQRGIRTSYHAGDLRIERVNTTPKLLNQLITSLLSGLPQQIIQILLVGSYYLLHGLEKSAFWLIQEQHCGRKLPFVQTCALNGFPCGGLLVRLE